MADPIEIGPPVYLEFEVVTPASVPGGLRCGICDRVIETGQPFVSQPTALYEDGDTRNLLTCVYCPAEAS